MYANRIGNGDESSGDGWRFRGAALCTVESTKTVHLLYARNTESVSVFSLPVPVAGRS